MAAPGESNASAEPETAPPTDQLTREIWREPEAPKSWYWGLLRLPELTLRLATTPLVPLITVAQDERIDKRTYDLLTNDEGTLLVLPVFVAATRDGVGGGFRVFHSNALGNDQDANVGALVRQNRDFSVSAGISRRIPYFDGRKIGGALRYSIDRNESWFGVGGDSSRDDERAIREQKLGARAKIELFGPQAGFISVKSALETSYQLVDLQPGTGAVPAGIDGDEIAPPPAFEQQTHYADAEWSFTYDGRDTGGRTSRGVRYRLALSGATAIDGEPLSAFGAKTRLTGFIPVAPLHRVLALSVGVAGVTPFSSGHEVPLPYLVTLGRNQHLRGYRSDRFYGNVAWWGTVEYRYPVWSYRGDGVGLSSMLFFDVGRVGVDVKEAVDGEIRYSYGFGIRAETPSLFLVRIQVGFSPEGAQVALSLNEGI